MSRLPTYSVAVCLCLALFTAPFVMQAQITPPTAPDTIPPMPSYEERSRNWGPNDTILTQAVWDGHDMMSYREESNVWISKLSPKDLQKRIAEWNRLRNAVYVCYPYARVAGATINDMNEKMTGMTGRKERKAYIQSREKELKKQFTEPLSNLSVYQGRVLMKLINRQTGNNCYDIIKEYKGGLNARMYQTVAFFFGSSLKQDYDVKDKNDRQIENFVNEIDGAWYQNPMRAKR